MAPECLQGQRAGCRSHIFPLGVVLEEMAGAQTAPDAFRSLVVRATARDRRQRVGSGTELFEALRRLHEIAETGLCETPAILLIEDDIGWRDAPEMGLVSEGYRVLNGRAASAALCNDGARLESELI